MCQFNSFLNVSPTLSIHRQGIGRRYQRGAQLPHALYHSGLTQYVSCIQERVDELFEQIGVKSPDGLVITFSNFVNFVRLRDADLRVMFDEVRGATALVALSAHIADSKCTHVLFHPG